MFQYSSHAKWLKTQWGELINIDHVCSIMRDEDNEKNVRAYFENGEYKILASFENGEDAQIYIDSIFDILK